MIIVDIECNNNSDVVIIGVMSDIQYLNYVKYKEYYYNYYNSPDDFIKFIKDNKIKEIFCHNLEYDFFKIFQSLSEPVKFSGYYSTAGLSYIQQGNIIWKDLYNHLPYSLAHIGQMLGIEKGIIDYEKINEVNQELIDYNTNDCYITMKAIEKLKQVYQKERINKVKSTAGSQAMYIYLRKFFCGQFKKIKKKDLDIWRKGYKGGWVECFKYGSFQDNTFYKVDVNSIYPFVMRNSLPLPYLYKIKNKLTKFEKDNFYWLGVKNNDYTFEVYNSIEHKNINDIDYYYLFLRKVYPFKMYVNYFYNKKENTTGLEKHIYKKLLNSLYGKFAQLNIIDIISNYNFKNKNNIIYEEQIFGNLYRIKKVDSKNKFWVNIVWSLFITAKARQYMRQIYKYIRKKGLEVYYVDTDAFIISGDIKKIKNIINDNKLGLFKIEDMSNEIEIRGKKFYRFGEVSRCLNDCLKCQLKDCIYKCKGIPIEYRKKFFENDYVKTKKFVRFRESLARGLKSGSIIEIEKRNIKNEQKYVSYLLDKV